MYNNTIQDIIKSINVIHAKGDREPDVYDFEISVGENTFKFEYVENDIPDMISIDGYDISTENLYDMAFKIDGEWIALGDIMRQCLSQAYKDAEIWLACDKQEQAEQASYRDDVRSILYNGRV